jgi:predicted metal-dependent HD superfamily phosphohydrolase
VRHLEHVCRTLEGLLRAEPVTAEGARAARLAACFHDAVYDPRRADNEAASAALARRTIGELGLERYLADDVAALVEATASLDAGAAALDERLAAATAVLLDADRAILAAPPAAYQRYVTGVRAEYAHLPEEAWVAGRRAVVRRLLQREPCFDTASMRSRSPRARANLSAELADLARAAELLDQRPGE